MSARCVHRKSRICDGVAYGQWVLQVHVHCHQPFEDRHTIAIATLDVLSSARARAGTVTLRVLSRCVVVVFCSPFPPALGDRGPNAWGFGAVW